MKVSIFTSVKQTTKPQHTSTKTVLDLIRTGGKQKEFLMALREMPEDEYKKRKTELPIILFGGTFSQRNKESLIGGSGLLTLDFDGVEDLTGLRDELTSKPYMYSVFLSPSGRGYKALVRIPIVKTDEEYKKYFAALKREFKTVDVSGKDISRSCFFSYDPEIYVNTNCELWDTKYETPKQKTENKPYQVKNGAWGNINTALRKIEDSVDGEKHNVRTKIAYLFGGYVSSGAMTYEDAYRLLEGAVSKNTSDLKSAMQTIKDCLDAGMAEPLNMTEQRRVLDMKVGLGRKYNQMAEVFDKVKDIYKNGYQRGASTGWSSVDDYYTIKKGYTTIIFSPPYSGKTNLHFNILVNLSEKYGWKHFIMSPESGGIEDVYAELTSIKAKKSFTGDYKMSEDEMIKHADFISQHFIIIDPEGEEMTLSSFFEQVEAAEREFNVKFDTTSIDPWNELTLDLSKYGLREDKMLERELTIWRQNAKRENRHNFIITHVVNQELKHKKLSNGETEYSYYPMPSRRQISGGQVWERKGQSMVCIYRPVDIQGEPINDERGIPYDKNTTLFSPSKLKPKGVGRQGVVRLYYDFKRNSYYEIDDLGKEYYAWGEPRNESAQPLQINPDSEQETKAVRWGSELNDVKNEADSHTPF